MARTDPSDVRLDIIKRFPFLKGILGGGGAGAGAGAGSTGGGGGAVIIPVVAVAPSDD